MPNSIPAVGDEIKPPNVLGQFSNVLGLKQQMLGIQQQQAGVQTAQAEAQQAQQKNQELQQAQGLLNMAMQKGSPYWNPDGTLNTGKLTRDMQSIGPYVQTFANQAVTRSNEMMTNRMMINNLNTAQQNELADVFTSLSSKPDLTHSDVINALSAAAERNPQLTRLTTSWAAGIPIDATTAQLQAAVKRMALASHGAEAGTPGMQTILTSRGQQPTATNIASPFFGQQGQPIQPGIQPQIVTQPGTQGQFVVGPSAGQVNPVGGQPQGHPPQSPTQQPGALGQPPQQPQQNWWQPQPGQAQWLQQTTAATVQRAQQYISAANTSPQALDALDRMRAILDQGVWTGTAFSGFKDLKNLAASMGLDTTAAQNASELVKNMARYEAARAAAVGDTDASRSLVEAGSPNYKMDAKAIRSVVLQSMANERIIQSFGNVMESSPNPQIAMQREQQLRSIPHLLQMFELGEMHNPEEVNDFLKRYDISGSELAKSRKMYMKFMGTGAQ
ncbi:MAG: hypothetical protein KGL39_13845 [Patescibacteria group bacterium]|nr:hypothetical protein [Patescibacteria group bacterium]